MVLDSDIVGGVLKRVAVSYAREVTQFGKGKGGDPLEAIVKTGVTGQVRMGLVARMTVCFIGWDERSWAKRNL